jgi:hypothetical protein
MRLVKNSLTIRQMVREPRVQRAGSWNMGKQVLHLISQYAPAL